MRLRGPLGSCSKLRVYVGWSLLGLSFGLIFFTVINFQIVLLDQLSPERDKDIIPLGFFDKTPVASLINASGLIPFNQTVVVSDHGPLSKYFLKHEISVPYGADSEKSLIEYMKKYNYNYLLVYEGYSAEKGLKSLFSSEGLKKLDNNFKEIAKYSRDYGSIHVYERIV
jgi:hypothetical protein